MKPDIGPHVAVIVENSKISALLSIFTTTAGLSTLLEYLPGLLGIIATLSGITLTWVMICKTMLQVKALKNETEEE